jgi:hypothetical protein
VIFGFFIFLRRENKPWPPLSPWAARFVSDMLGWRLGRRGRVEGAVAQPVRLAYQPPGSSTFLSEQTSHQQPASSTLLSEQTSTSHQPPANRTGWLGWGTSQNQLYIIYSLIKLFCRINKKY